MDDLEKHLNADVVGCIKEWTIRIIRSDVDTFVQSVSEHSRMYHPVDTGDDVPFRVGGLYNQHTRHCIERILPLEARFHRLCNALRTETDFETIQGLYGGIKDVYGRWRSAKLMSGYAGHYDFSLL